MPGLRSLPSPAKMRSAVRHADRRLRFAREMRRTAYQMRAGRFAYPNAYEGRLGLNLIDRGVNVLTAHLMAKNPEVDIEAKFAQLKGEAVLHDMMIDEQLKRLDHKKNMRLALQDALLGPACVLRVGIRAGEDTVVVNDRNIPIGQPYYQRIDYDDYVFDPSARDAEEMQWEGCRWRIPREAAMELGWLGDKKTIEAMPRVDTLRGEHEGGGVHNALEQMSRESQNREYEEADLIEFLDVFWYRDDGCSVHVLPMTSSGYEEYVHEYEWEGPIGGPLMRLEFNPIANQTYAMPWVAQAREQAEDLAKLQGKFIEQAMRSRNILVGGKGAEDDLLEVEETGDGETVLLDDPNNVNVYQLGDISPAVVQGMVTLQAWWDVSAGQIDQKSGGQSNANTATEFAGLQANAQVMNQDMQSQFEEFQNRIVEFLGWYNTTDPLIQKPLGVRVPGGEKITVTYDAATRKGGFPDFIWKIRRRSTLLQDPSVRAARLMEVGQVLGTYAQLAMAGVPVDPMAAARFYAREFDLHGIEEIILDPVNAQFQQQLLQLVGPAAMPGQGQPQGMSPVSTGQAPQPGGGGGGNPQRPQQQQSQAQSPNQGVRKMGGM